MIDFYGRKFRTKVNFIDSDGSGAQQGFVTTGDECPMSLDAELVISEDEFEQHCPLIDLDVEHHYEQSSTPGHGHLYINHAMTFEQMMKLFDVMVEVGVMQRGFRDATRARGFAAVRTPWTVK